MDCLIIDCVSIGEVSPVNRGIVIELNPTRGDFEIVVDAMHSELTFEIIDATGKVLQEVYIEGNSTAKITLNEASGGQMICALTQWDWYTGRFVKQ